MTLTRSTSEGSTSEESGILTLTPPSFTASATGATRTDESIRTPIDDYLARQADLSAVERFSSHHDRADGSELEGWYRDLLPATPPAPGQQYRFEVDMDACTSCKSCVAACHSLNGLDEGESWRSVGVVIGWGDTGPTQQTVTTACHHCVDPACLAGCPVDAYEKDPFTGIVKHLDDQCIGCSYCTWTCPYEVPQFNDRLGIVRKCDMCTDRLAEGEAPACVQACPTGAIAIGVVETADLRAALSPDAVLVPGAPASTMTVPSTRYHRAEPLPADAEATDVWSEAPKHAHFPLVVMLVLTQLSVGTFAVLSALTVAVDGLAHTTIRAGAVIAALAGVMAIGASVGHLGRPLMAWRAVIGFSHSWLSREIVAFGAFAPLAVVAAGWRLVEPTAVAADVVGVAVSVVGLAAVGCSAAIYAVTGRRFWRLDRTLRSFATTLVLCGSATAVVVVVCTVGDVGATAEAVRVLLMATVLVSALTVALDLWTMNRATAGDESLDRSARLLRGPLASAWRGRLLVLGLGGIGLPVLLAVALAESEPSMAMIRTLAVVSLLCLVRSELTGRSLFFRAMSSPRMPGMPR